jgi:hypothetical protein
MFTSLQCRKLVNYFRKKIVITQELINDRLFSKLTQVLNYINVPALSTAHQAYSLRYQIMFIHDVTGKASEIINKHVPGAPLT